MKKGKCLICDKPLLLPSQIGYCSQECIDKLREMGGDEVPAKDEQEVPECHFCGRECPEPEYHNGWYWCGVCTPLEDLMERADRLYDERSGR